MYKNCKKLLKMSAKLSATHFLMKVSVKLRADSAQNIQISASANNFSESAKALIESADNCIVGVESNLVP